LLAGLLALASVLGVGEGHLLHRETRWVGSRYFAKSESLFQSFLSMNLTAGMHHSKNPQTIKADDRMAVGVMTDFPVNSVNRIPMMVVKKTAAYANL
ncbi:hypothetical protein J1N39_17210, partial [Pseudomonas aeruginosa]|uniref:hypothetical protein n=1 Tax=Pseudomonas aeruginosa TaxID=287 RepID=UPI001CBDF89E